MTTTRSGMQRSLRLALDAAARQNPELSVARRAPMLRRLKVPTRRATRDGRRIAAGMIAPPLPGASALLRFLTKRDISGTAPGTGARLSERLASNASGLRRNR